MKDSPKNNVKRNVAQDLALGWWLKTTQVVSAAAAAKSLQSCPTLCDPIDSSPTGSPVPGILQTRTLEWVAISFSNAWKWKVKVKSLSCVRLLVTPWTAAYQAPPSMGFSRQEYWSGVPLPSLCRDATLPNLKYQLSMTFMIKAKIFATGQTALMICALTLSLTALPSPTLRCSLW